MANEAQAALPIFVIGDSHALPYKNLVFRERWAGQWVLTRARYVSGLTAHDLYKPETSEYHPEVIRFLEYEGLIRNGFATHLSLDETDFSIIKAGGQPATPPLILLTVGDIDVRGALLPMFKDGHDFVPPYETDLPRSGRPLVPWDEVDEAIENRIAPLAAGLRNLVASGFNRIYVQAVVPPSPDDALIRALHGYDCPAVIRARLVVAFNRKLEAACRSAGVTFLDLSTKLAESGLLRRDLDFDGIHIPPAGARWYVEALLEHAINCQWFAVNHVRYAIFYRQACGLNPFSPNPTANV